MSTRALNIILAQLGIIVALTICVLILAGLLSARAAESPATTPVTTTEDKPVPGEKLGVVPETAPEPTTTEAMSPPEPQPEAVNLGEFKLYAYCPCSACCGKWAGGKTASGTVPQQGRTVAVDPEVIPLGSLILVDGVAYIAEDTGYGVDGNTLDIYHDSHQEALEHGVQYADVWLLPEVT